MSSQSEPNIEGGNLFDKYGSKNPLVKLVTNGFLRTLDEFVLSLYETKSILEVGCGDGYLLNRISKLSSCSRLEGLDVSEGIIKKAARQYPDLKFVTGSVYKLPYKDNEFDLVVACEVLEHLDDYERGIKEIKRVAKNFCIISVPLEPLFRSLNVMRGKYLASFGNTPGHVQHWGIGGLKNLAKNHFKQTIVKYPLPWQMVLCHV